jgi:hypothetical protein
LKPNREVLIENFFRHGSVEISQHTISFGLAYAQREPPDNLLLICRHWTHVELNSEETDPSLATSRFNGDTPKEAALILSA